MKLDGSLLDLLVPPSARQDPRRRLRHRGVAKSLLSISGVVAFLFLAYVLMRPNLTLYEVGLFVAGIITPFLGTLFVRATGRIELGLLLTNMGGIGIVAVWCAFTGGIASVALPWFLPNLFLLSTFGSRRMLVKTAGMLLPVLALLFLATVRGWLPPSLVPDSMIPIFTLLSMMSAVALVVVAAYALTGEREKSKGLLLEAKNAAESANRAKSVFLASMSHELRTPLHAMLLSTDLLDEDRDPPLSAKQAHMVGQLRLGGEQLLGLVNQVLELSSIEAGKTSLSLVATPLSESLSSALSVVLPLARRRHIQIDFDLESLSGLQVLADPVQLTSIWINLLSNAVKYNRQHGRVFIDAAETPAGKVRVEIRDTGSGMPDHLRDKAFQPFNRLGAEGTHIAGVGLGLSITERLLQMMSGSLGCESVQGQGSTFWVELPAVGTSTGLLARQLPAAVDGTGVASTLPGPAANPLDVLIVEDHPINQQLLRQTLENRGHRVTVASNGVEALQALGDHGRVLSKFDVILMDLLMPVMGGLEATRRIRQMEVGSDWRIPIVAVTACALDQDREACFEAGMDSYLAKPVKTRDLVRLMHDLRLGRRPSPAPEPEEDVLEAT